MSDQRQNRERKPQAKQGSEEQRDGLARRELLQVGMLGVAGSLVGAGSAAAQAQPAKRAESCEPPRPKPTSKTARAVVPGDPETWNEPWVWRPGDWPGQQLDLNIVENQNPGVPVGLGNPGSVLFSYGGDTPGPTIRMKGDETLSVKLRNLLGQDFGDSFIRAYPHVADAPKGSGASLDADTKAKQLGNYRQDFCLGEHANGVHSIRVTNLHTHGLHVRPGRNPDGAHSDNVILRVMSQADFKRRQREGREGACAFLRNPQELYYVRDDEQVGEADYEFRLGNVQRELVAAENRKRVKAGKEPLPPQPHPAGTFWYHPHSHGATHNQVASGMAGFLLVEGDVEEAINRVLVGWKDGDPEPDPSIKTGPYDYRERLMLMQRALNLSADKDASKRSPGLQGASSFQPLVNGGSTPTVITMRPGAVERWRVLNGSVDGRGYKRLMVVRGQYTVVAGPDGNFDTYRVKQDGSLEGPVTLAGLEELESRKQDLHQLSVDGVTLVRKSSKCKDSCSQVGGCKHTGDCGEYFIKPLAEQNAGSANPLWSRDQETFDTLCARIAEREENGDYQDPCSAGNARKGADLYSRLVNVWKSPRHVEDCFVRPNEFYMGPANRTDVFFQAPRKLTRSYTKPSSPAGCPPQKNAPSSPVKYEIYTVLARTVFVHSDTPMQNAQKTVVSGQGLPAPEDVILAWVLVEDDTGSPGKVEQTPMSELMGKLENNLPPVQQYLLPVCDEELVVCPEEVEARRDLKPGDYRTRRVLYSGWGHPNMPLVSTYPIKPLEPLKGRGQAQEIKRASPTARAFARFVFQDQRDKVTYVDSRGQTVTEGRYQNLIYTEHPTGSGYFVLLPPEIRTMAIGFDNPRLADEQTPDAKLDQLPWVGGDLPRKFNPSDPYRARMLENTAEQWTLYNLTNPLFGNTDPDAQPKVQWGGHYVSHPFERAEGQRRFLENPYYQVTAKGIDHPFHVHQNPFWVSRIEIPDENGELVNILSEPRWMDSIWIPRNRGRVVFRMRFPDYVGAYVHHCHILLHEDNGMMHVIEATPFRDESNFTPSRSLDPADRPSPEESYTRSYTFVDPNPMTGQVYPGFRVTPPGEEY